MRRNGLSVGVKRVSTRPVGTALTDSRESRILRSPIGMAAASLRMTCQYVSSVPKGCGISRNRNPGGWNLVLCRELLERFFVKEGGAFVVLGTGVFADSTVDSFRGPAEPQSHFRLSAVIAAAPSYNLNWT